MKRIVAGLLMAAALPAAAEVRAKYTFDGRIGRGQREVRTHSACWPYDGVPYEPNAAAGELGPVLLNPGGGGESWRYYRSFLANDHDDATRGRQVLELAQHHAWYEDCYRTPDGAGPLPESGSFTWELVVRIDGFDGADHLGLLLDATRGEGREPGWPSRAITCRLWMGARKENRFPLCFSLPTNAEGQVVTATTELVLAQWYHLTAVYDDVAHRARIYVDGKLAAEVAAQACGGRSKGLALAGFGPEVIRVDHPARFDKGYVDALAVTDDVRGPGRFALAP